jgi:quinoprotein glucose dehydrogenase
MTIALGASARAQTTLDGVYTKEQAARGKQIYAGMCRSCHTPVSHAGDTFEKAWLGRTMADLYTYVSERMPKNDPAGMPPQDYADVIAYLLTMNAMPAGKRELQPDSAALAPIRIVVQKKKPTQVRKKP